MIAIPVKDLAIILNVSYNSIIHYLGHFTLFKYCVTTQKDCKSCKGYILNKDSINALGNYLIKKKRSVDEIDDLIKYYNFQRYKQSLD